jgi:hypothetical protein
LVALADIMRLSLKKGAHSALSSAAWQEIRVRFGRDDKGEGGVSMESGLGQKAFFITLGGPQAHDSSGRDDEFVARKCSEHPMDKWTRTAQQICHLDRA